MVKTNRKAKTGRLALTGEPGEADRRLACCVPSPERDAVLQRIMVELAWWPTYYLVHLLPALAAHTGVVGSEGGAVKISVADGSLWDRLEKLERRGSR